MSAHFSTTFDPTSAPQTFLHNPRLAASLNRLAAQRPQAKTALAASTARPAGVISGIETEGSDATDPFANPRDCASGDELNGGDAHDPNIPPRVYDYLVQFIATDEHQQDMVTECYRVRACDFTTALTGAIEQAIPKHPQSSLRVGFIKELDN